MEVDGVGGLRPIPSHVLSLEQAEERINPYKDLLAECIHFGWNAWMNDYKQKHPILSARSRAAIVFDEIKSRAHSVFGAIDDVKLVARANSFMLYIGDDIALRFKKLRRNGLCSNIITHQQMLFQAQMCLPGFLPGTLVHAGYMLDDLQREISRALVVCQFEDSVLWTIRLGQSGSAGGAIEFAPLPAPTDQPGPRWQFTGEKAEEAQKAEDDSNQQNQTS